MEELKSIPHVLAKGYEYYSLIDWLLKLVIMEVDR
jgi:hypothetical protein